MSLNINKKIIEQTDNCNKDLKCIEDGKPGCKVEEIINNKIHFVKCLSHSLCNYKIPFGDYFICQCPVRKEIHRLYKI